MSSELLVAKPGLEIWSPILICHVLINILASLLPGTDINEENESKWIESFMYCICASAGSSTRLNDGFLEGLRLLSQPDLQRGGGPRESLHHVAWEM